MNPVPFVDLTRRYAALKPEIDAAVARTLASGWYLLGDEARGFEEEFGAYLTSPQPLSRPVASSLGKGLFRRLPSPPVTPGSRG